MLHEFVCCENLPADAATSAFDLLTPRSTLQLGKIHACVNAQDIPDSGVQLKCKNTVSLQDLMSSSNSVMLSTSSAATANSSSNEPLLLVDRSRLRAVNIETCSVMYVVHDLFSCKQAVVILYVCVFSQMFPVSNGDCRWYIQARRNQLCTTGL
jgi:hypothetical protein